MRKRKMKPGRDDFDECMYAVEDKVRLEDFKLAMKDFPCSEDAGIRQLVHAAVTVARHGWNENRPEMVLEGFVYFKRAVLKLQIAMRKAGVS